MSIVRQEHIQGKLHTQGSILRIKEGQMLILRALIIIIQKETLTIKGELKMIRTNIINIGVIMTTTGILHKNR